MTASAQAGAASGVPPLTSGQRIEVEVEDLAFGGEGVARCQDFVVFIPFVIPGERVRVEVVEVKKNFARARLLEVMAPSPARVAPPCPYFGDCGGCQYQHIQYARQLELKHKQVMDLLERIGGVTRAQVEPVAACPQPYGYRNRIMVRSQWNKQAQRLVLGYLGADNRRVVDVEQCLIADPRLNEQLLEARRHPPPRGGLKVVLRLEPEGWEVPPDSFFQTNFHALPLLVEAVRRCLQEGGAEYLVDAYCGVGFFALSCADLVQHFLGVEVDVAAVRAARRNARQRDIRNGEFFAARTEDLLPDILLRYAPERTAVVLDPPRTGCPAPSLELLRRQRVRQIIYISCHPAALARDLNILCAGGVYELVRVRPVDMFPQTQHVECVADLRWRGGGG
ncbi:MAG: class I SAM-dependent RNA methyltransferase [Verrucomicrobiae bacterium]|nr:class I SAM-dependent RNA methyltransferase [Verrucomicrobiae bacterium]